MITEVDHPTIGKLKLVSPPVKYSESQPTIRSPPPTLGQHTDEILAEVGISEEGIKALRDEGVVA
jgi:succinate---hydroxymethylglutarate CoA-transferase